MRVAQAAQVMPSRAEVGARVGSRDRARLRRIRPGHPPPRSARQGWPRRHLSGGGVLGLTVVSMGGPIPGGVVSKYPARVCRTACGPQPRNGAPTSMRVTSRIRTSAAPCSHEWRADDGSNSANAAHLARPDGSDLGLELREQDDVADRRRCRSAASPGGRCRCPRPPSAAARIRARGRSRRRSTSPPRRPPRLRVRPARGSAPPGPRGRSARRSRWRSRGRVMNSSKRSVTAGFASFARASGDTSVGMRDDERRLDELLLGRLPRRASAAARPTPSVGNTSLVERRQRDAQVVGLRELVQRVLRTVLVDRLGHRQPVEAAGRGRSSSPW